MGRDGLIFDIPSRSGEPGVEYDEHYVSRTGDGRLKFGPRPTGRNNKRIDCRRGTDRTKAARENEKERTRRIVDKNKSVERGMTEPYKFVSGPLPVVSRLNRESTQCRSKFHPWQPREFHSQARFFFGAETLVRHFFCFSSFFLKRYTCSQFHSEKKTTNASRCRNL